MMFIAGAPWWVWPILVALLYLGYRSSKTRTTSALGIYLLPLLIVFSLHNVVAMRQRGVAIAVYVLAYALGALLGYAVQRRWLLGKQGNRVTLAGEWVTLIVLMVMFWAKFLRGAAQAIRPEVFDDPFYVAAFVATVGLASGSFLGRAVRVWRAKA